MKSQGMKGVVDVSVLGRGTELAKKLPEIMVPSAMILTGMPEPAEGTTME